MINRSIGRVIFPVNMVSFCKMIHRRIDCFKDGRLYHLDSRAASFITGDIIIATVKNIPLQ